MEKRIYYGNNNRLIDIARQSGFDIPADYFDRIDKNGNYKGRSYKARDFSRKLGKGRGRLLRPQDPPGGSFRDEPFAMNSLLTTTDFFIPLRFIVHQNQNGVPAFTNQEIMDAFNETEEIFRTEVGNIYLYIEDIQFRNNSAEFILDNFAEANFMLEGTSSPDHITVHFVSQAPSAGQAFFVPSRKCYVARGDQPFWDNSILAHELGHNMGLVHTHRGDILTLVSNGNRSNCNQESVDRNRTNGPLCVLTINMKKCEVNGDGLCDTPADPEIDRCPPDTDYDADNSGAETEDNWGDVWEPDLVNIMSYADACRDNFSVGQALVMQDQLLNNNKFDFVQHTGENQITTLVPTVVCPGNTIFFTAPNSPNGLPNANYVWETPPGWTANVTNFRTLSLTVPVSASPGSYEVYARISPALANNGLFNEGTTIQPFVVSVSSGGTSISVSGPGSLPPDGFCRNYSTDHEPGLSYTWSLAPTGGNPVPSSVVICSGQGSSAIRLRANGTGNDFLLRVSRTDNCGASLFADKLISIEYSPGVEVSIGGDHDELPRQVSFFPNPVVGQLGIKLGRDTESIEDVTITNAATGQVIYRYTCLEEKEIQLKQMPAGLYLIRYSVTGQYFTQKIIQK